MEINIIHPAEHHHTSKRGPSTFDINSLSRLGAIHTRVGHSHYSGLLSTMGLPSLTSPNFKTQEREGRMVIEAVVKEPCNYLTEKEKQLSAIRAGEKEAAVMILPLAWKQS